MENDGRIQKNRSMKKYIYLLSLILYATSLCAQQVVSIDLSKRGRVFEGLGALSAGASSRLLIEYEEPYRSLILDYLFKPKFGANIQHLKVEIGGDINSTSGTEPSHARTRQEYLHPQLHYFQRGYEWWLMKEAKKRNPAIMLDALQWGAPGWIGDGKFYSDDNIDFIISFVKGAKEYHDLDINYVGIWNERMYNTEYIKQFRKKMNKEFLSNVKLVAADITGAGVWSIGKEMLKDNSLRKAIDVIGDHYIERETAYKSPEEIQDMGHPVWNNEGGPWRGDWVGFAELAKLYNRDYIEGKITKTITWSLITSYYENLALPNSGLMKANTPWSGYYEVQPAIWAIAHTTQFADPGWVYIDGGCGYLKEGSYVTLHSDTQKEDISMIIETIDASAPQKVTFTFSPPVENKEVYVWKSTVDGELFGKEKSLSVRNGSFSVQLEPKSLYTITTTTGQMKGIAFVPAEELFPFPYTTGFEEEALLTSPRYFSDQGGAFEIVMREDGSGKCLRQVITRPGIEWEGSVLNQTVLGDTLWTDYIVKSDVYFAEPYSEAFLSGRVMEMYRSHKPADAYYFKLQSSGHWALMTADKTLSSGWIPVDTALWHTLELKMKGEKITASVNNQAVCEIEDDSFTHGMAGLRTSFHTIDFDNFSIRKDE